ncbi:MAG TPA: outer membrane lipoprotein carrier protein LolA, partial [bacterium]|nr:outer membrane lipoprotein carrier protein LolA [bacterium]
HIISDGSTLVMVSEQEKKAYVTKTGAQFDIRQPLAILTGQVDLCNTYDASLLEPADGRKRIKLVPKKPTGFQSMILHVDPNTSLVQAIESVDAYGNKTLMKLSNQQFNRGLPESKFVFTPRADIEVVDQPMLDF